MTLIPQLERHLHNINYETSISQFSFRKPAYNSQPRQSYYRHNTSSRNGSRSRNNRSNWQSVGYSHYRPSYQSWTGSNSVEDEDKIR